jgi:hypothetical protein
MNTFIRLAATGMPRFSTDQTASSVNRFISLRAMLTSRPETSARRPHTATAPDPLEVLYPSLYTERESLVQRCGNYFRAFVIALGNRRSLRDKHASRFIGSAK